MRKFLLALLLSGYPTVGEAQQAVQQSGNVTPGHPVMWVTNGIVGDGGTAAQGNLSSLGITASGPSLCINSAPVTAAGWQQFCFGVTTSSGGTISVKNFGTATAQPFTVTVNGTPYQFPFTATGVVGPISTTIGDLVLWNNTAGTLASDFSGVTNSLPYWTAAHTLTNFTGAASSILYWSGASALTNFAGTANSLLYWSGASALTNLATANSSILVTDGSGVPGLSTTLPNGVVATTQTSGDNTTKVATDAFVQTAVSTLPNGATATTQATNDSTTKVATDAFVQNQLATSNVLGNGTTTTTQAVGDITTKLATDAFVQNQLAQSVSPGNASFNVYNVRLAPYNALCNYNVVSDGVMASGSSTLTSATASFKLADVGKYIAVQSAGGAGASLYTTIATFVNITTITLSNTNSGGNISALTVEYGSDDTAAFQNAINAVVTAGGGTVYIPTGSSCLVSRLNITNTSAPVTIRGDGLNATRIFPLQVASYGTSSGHMFDLTGSSFIRLENFQIGAYYELAKPTTAVFMAQVASGSSNRNGMDHMYISGQFSATTFYDYGVPSLFVIKDCDLYNYAPGAGTHNTMYLTATNILSLTSSFATVTSGTKSTSDIAFLQVEFHKFAGAGADNSVVMLDAAANISFFSGVMSGGATYYVQINGTNGSLSFHNVTMETESQVVTPSYAYYIQAGTFTWLDDPGSTYIIGSGSFSSLPTTTTSVHYSR